MANLIVHRFHSAKVDGADATQVQPSNWNDDHVFAGGNAADVLTRDPSVTPSGAKWAPLPPGTPGGGNLNDVLTRDPSIVPAGSKWAPIPAALPPGGALGDILTRDATVAIYGSKWVTPVPPPWNTWAAWIAATYMTGWSTYPGFAGARYRLDPTGKLVYLSGTCTNNSGATTSANSIFTLPVGFRPASPVLTTGIVGGLPAEIAIDFTGLVYVNSVATNTYVCLGGIFFALDQ